MEEKAVRLNRYLAECGLCSRREADRMIADGRVSIDGKRALIGSLVTKDNIVKADNRLLKGKEEKEVLVYYKPVGVTCTERDVHAQKTIKEAFIYPVRVTYAGRLDKDSEGLMLMSNDGDLIQQMMRAANQHEKEYMVKVKKEIDAVFMQKMADGIFLKELGMTTRRCVVEKLGKYTFRIILTQGLNRQIRRMCEALGNRVIQLKRVRIMNIELGALKPGEYRKITKQEEAILYEQCFGDSRQTEISNRRK